MTILLWQRGYYIVPICDLQVPILRALPMKVKDGGFQHDANHANCRSKGKSCGPANSNCPVDHLVGVFHNEVLGGLLA